MAPKAGSAEAEYEDAAWPDSARVVSAVERFRCAVADGATETSYARSWARILVGAYANSRLAGPTDGELLDVRARWGRGVRARLSKPHPWYADVKAESGAFAALVTLYLRDESRVARSWTAYAVGDCCLVQIRSNSVIAAFPLEDSASFDNRPRLLGSVKKDGLDAADVIKTTGEWQDGDSFFLLSDAVACWFHKRREAGEEPWDWLTTLNRRDERQFRLWVMASRAAKEMKNDDVTVLRVLVADDAAP